MSTLFVTASGTEVGKTFVTCALIRQLRRRGRRVRALKPVATGVTSDTLDSSDTGILLRALRRPADPGSAGTGRVDSGKLDARRTGQFDDGRTGAGQVGAGRGDAGQHDRLIDPGEIDARQNDRQIDAISPWRFAAPLSPDMAAEREGRRIPFTDLVAFCRRESAADITLIEGVGGVMAPLDRQHTVLDWVTALAAPVLLVTGSYLGTLSHTLTAAGMLRAQRVTVAGLIVNESGEQPVAPQETAAVLARFLPDIPIRVVGRVPVRAIEHADGRNDADGRNASPADEVPDLTDLVEPFLQRGPDDPRDADDG